MDNGLSNAIGRFGVCWFGTLSILLAIGGGRNRAKTKTNTSAANEIQAMTSAAISPERSFCDDDDETV